MSRGHQDDAPVKGHVGYTVTTGHKADEVPHFYHQPPVGAASGSDFSQSANPSTSARVADSLLGSTISSVVPSQRHVTVAPVDSGGAETSQQGAMSDLPVELGMLDGPQRRYSRSLGGDPENREWQSGLRDWLQSGDEAPLFDEADALAAEELFGDDAMDADDSLDYPVERKKGSAGKRRTGRPLAYTGDPDSPALSEADKRKIKRRIANRESARRIRNRQLQKTEALLKEIQEMRESQAALKARAEQAEQEKAGLAHRVEDLRGKATASEFENQQLRQEAHNLRNAYEANLSALESALSKQDSALEHSQLPDQLQPVETPFAGPASHESFLGQAQRGAPHGQGSLEDMLLHPKCDPHFDDTARREQYFRGSFEDMLLDPKCDPHLTAAGDADIFGSVNLDKLPLLTESTEFAAAALRQPSDG